MNRGEIYRSREDVPERGPKPGFYVVVSRGFVAGNEDAGMVICAPIYSRRLGLETEVALSTEDGVTHDSAIRCDFLMLMFKERLRHLAGTLRPSRIAELDRALAIALELPVAPVVRRRRGH